MRGFFQALVKKRSLELGGEGVRIQQGALDANL
jgi:hypothetical protein